MNIGPQFGEVLQAARDGEDWAWSRLYQTLAADLLRFLTAQGAADPEDCLGEAFVSLVKGLPNFEGDERALRAFAFTIARSRLVDSWRRASCRPASAELDSAAEHRHQSPAADTATLASDSVTEILETLTPDQRSVLLLRVLHEFSVKETAAILDRSEGAVKLLQHRAVSALRARLMGRSPGEQ